MFEGFATSRVDAGGVEIHVRRGGKGPPLLLLHGYPETHAMWHRIASPLAERFTVVAPDLRGYGDSAKPSGGVGHQAYAKRALAADMVEVMESLGYVAFHVVGHDRGGRVGHRMARDHGRRVRTLTVLDISPTLKMYQSTSLPFAKAYYHWFFLIQEAPLPETMVAAMGVKYILGRIGRGPSKLKRFDPRAVAEYARCFRDPRTIHATCEDYRASATIEDRPGWTSRNSRKPLLSAHSATCSISSVSIWRRYIPSAPAPS